MFDFHSSSITLLIYTSPLVIPHPHSFYQSIFQSCHSFIYIISRNNRALIHIQISPTQSCCLLPPSALLLTRPDNQSIKRVSRLLETQVTLQCSHDSGAQHCYRPYEYNTNLPSRHDGLQELQVLILSILHPKRRCHLRCRHW